MRKVSSLPPKPSHVFWLSCIHLEMVGLTEMGKSLMKKKEAVATLSLDGYEVQITHPDKPYFSREVKLSKLDLVRYYLAVAPGALVGIRNRPIVLKRFVNGAEKEAFYQNALPPTTHRGCVQ